MEELKELLKEDENLVNARDRDGKPLLAIAFENDYFDLAKELFHRKNIDLTIKDCYDRVPLDFASEKTVRKLVNASNIIDEFTIDVPEEKPTQKVDVKKKEEKEENPKKKIKKEEKKPPNFSFAKAIGQTSSVLKQKTESPTKPKFTPTITIPEDPKKFSPSFGPKKTE